MVGKDFLNRTQKTLSTKEKINIVEDLNGKA